MNGRRVGGLARGSPVHSYRVAGLKVASEIELPGAIPAQDVAVPAITVRAAAVPAALPDATKKGATWQIAGERFLFEVPNVVDAALILRRGAYRPLMVNRMGQKADYFRAATAIANAAGIFHLTRALNFAAMPDVTGWLEQHWLDIGLTERAA